MKEKIYVIAREGLRIREENGRLLPAEGAHVPLNSFWRRRLRDKDVIAKDAPRKAKATPKKNEE